MKYLFGREVKADILTPLERMSLFDQGKEIDRIPCCPDLGETMAPLLGMSLKEYYLSAENMCALEEHLYRTFGSDDAGLTITLRGMAEAMGAEFSYPDNNFPHIKRPGSEGLTDLSSAKKIDIEKDGKIPIVLEGLRLLKKRIGKEVPVGCMVPGPLTTAAMFLGTERLLVGLVKRPEEIKELLEIIVENNNRLCKRLIDMEVGIGFADPISSVDLIGAKRFREFSLPYFQKNVDFIRDYNGSCGLHICGKSRPIWEELSQTGIDSFSLDNVEDLAQAKEVMGKRLCIMGNVPPVDVMKNGTLRDVVQSTRQCILKAYDSPCGFILTTGCQLPMHTPVENIQGMMDSARVFGRYPIDTSILMEEISLGGTR